MIIESDGGKPLAAPKINATLTLLNSADQPVASVQPLAASDGQLKFYINSDLSGTDAVALVVDIRHEGFTSFSRRTPVEPTIYLQAKLAALTENVVMPAQAVSISGATTNGFTLQQQDPVDGAPTMSISIPASSLPAGTGSLTAAIKTYDPNDAEDAQYFPGSYADSTGNGLVSVAFNYAQVQTNTGESLRTVAQNARTARLAHSAIAFAAPPEPVIINRAIPASSCSTLEKLGDANTLLEGFQIPVYTYNPRSGLWDLLGYGTVFTDKGVAVKGDVTDLKCATSAYILEIKVTNEIFLSDWWNLDYPLLFSEPKKRCASLHILNEANETLAGVQGLITGNGNFSNSYFVSDENGNASVTVDVFSDEINTGNFYIWGKESSHGSFTLSNCPAPELQTIVVKRPQLCKIKGKIDYKGQGLSNVAVYAYSTEIFLSEYYFVYGTTNSEGIYTLDIACDTSYTVLEVLSQKENTGINVNGTVSPGELSDDGKLVTLQPVTYTEPPFDTKLYLVGYEPTAQEGVLLFLGMYDAFPISYDLKLKNVVTGQILVSAQGNLNFDPTLFEAEFSQWYLRAGQVKVPVVLPQDLTNYAVQGSYTDKFGVKVTVDQPLSLIPEGGLFGNQ